MTMTCETVREDLVAYHDGELSEQDRQQVAAHLSSCSSCAQEEAELAKVTLIVANMERITPSPDFAATFWRRLEQETRVAQTEPQESWLSRWWTGLRASLTGWQLAPMLASAASVLVFLGYLLSSSSHTPDKATGTKAPTAQAQSNVPAQLTDQLGLFVNYRVIADLQRLANFDQIASIDLSEEKSTEVADSDVPPVVIEKPNFFAQYPLLQKMEQLENMDAVLDSRLDEEDAQHQG
jgi:hypothetical protein